MVALDVATGKMLWDTKLPQMPFGAATVANDLVFTALYSGEVVALSRTSGAIVWRAQRPAGANAPLAIYGDTVIAGAGSPLAGGQSPMVVAYRLGASGHLPTTPAGPGQKGGTGNVLVADTSAHTAILALVAGSTGDNGGFNFDGASKGRLVVSIPVGYKVTVHFTNAVVLPHSAVITAYANRSGSSFPLAFPGATTPNALAGVGKGGQQTFSFTASQAGTYAIVCAVPGHAAAGMWDILQVTQGGLPSLSTTGAI
jgi:sulfocyanin